MHGEAGEWAQRGERLHEGQGALVTCAADRAARCTHLSKGAPLGVLCAATTGPPLPAGAEETPRPPDQAPRPGRDT